MANTANLVTIDIDQLTVNIRDIPGMFTFHVCIRDANTDERGIYNILQRENIPVLSQGQGEVTWVKFFDLHPHPTNSFHFHEGQFVAFVIILDKKGYQIAEGVSEPFHLTEGAIKFIRETYAAHERERQRDQDILATAQKQLREANERAAQTVANPAPTTGTAPPPATAPAAAQEETPRQENAPRRAAAAPSLITAWFRVFGTRRLSPISIIIIILLLLVIAFLINETAPSQSQEEPDHVNMEKEAAMKKVIAPIPIPTTKKVTVGKDNDLSFTVPNTPQDGGATATINTLNNSQFGDNALIEVNNKIEITDNRQTIVHPNGWPIDWKPTLPTVLASALPAGVYTFVLPPRGVQCIQVPEGCYVEPAQEDMLRIDVKYGTDNTCFDYGIGAPGQEVSGTQIRFRPKAFESGDVTVRIHIKPF